MNAAGRLSLYGAGVVVAFGGAFGIAAAVVPDSAVANWTAAADDSSMADHAGMTEEEEDHITSGVKRTLNEAVERADASPLPDPATVLEGVYAEPAELETPHHK